jgi:hypothetical protein
VPLIFSFGRDWLVVSATIDAASAGYQRIRRRAKLIFEQWLPPVVRLISAALVVGMLVQGEAVSGVMVWLAVLAAALLVLGVVGRAAALILAFVAAFSAAQVGLQLDNGLLLVCAVYILHLGSGRFALWTPEEYYLHAKLGARNEANA